MDRPIVYGQESLRSFDVLQGWRDTLTGLANLGQDQRGSTLTTASGFAATQTASPSLSINIAAGRIYQQVQTDTTAYGSLASDTDLILQQGSVGAQVLTLTTAALSSGQSQWALIQGSLSQVDAIRAGDPTAGILNFWNAANPSVPFVGPANNGLALSTVRQATAVLSVVYGTVAATGSQVPPNATGANIPLYLILLTVGQSTITTANILKTGPSVGAGVPGNYPVAPFLAGLLNSHHGGTPGQAPKINLATEVTGILPLTNMSFIRVAFTTATTIFVNPSTGSDANNGLTSGTAFATLQAAINSLYKNYDCNGFAATIKLADGTYSSAVANGFVAQFSGMPLNAASLTLTGNTVTPANVVLSATTGNCLGLSTSCVLNIAGISFTCTGNVQGPIINQGIGVFANSSSWANIANCVFNACGQAQILAANSSVVVFTGPNTLTGATTWALAISQGGQIFTVGQTITVGGLSFTTAFAAATQCGNINIYSTTFTGSATGPRYNVSQNGNIYTNGGGSTYLPGNSAGSAATGGNYI